MLGEMTDQQIDHVLQEQTLGRIACCVDGKPYVVPISYAYDGQYVYAHSREGVKIAMMRKNLNICFQVDIVVSMSNWRSVILNGLYEELENEEQQKALKILSERFIPLETSEAPDQPQVQSHPPYIIEKKLKAIVFRIRIKEKSGRFEKRIPML